MPCPCCQPPEFGDYEGMFDTEWATKEADAYIRHGLEARSERLIAFLVENCAGPLRVLDVGSGAGGVHHECGGALPPARSRWRLLRHISRRPA